MFDLETVEIAAVGKAISAQNGTKIMGAISYLLDVVANSGLLSADDLRQMVATAIEPGVTPPAHVNQHDSGEPSGDLSSEPSGDLSGELGVQAAAVETIQASSCCLLSAIEKRVWQNNLSTAMDVYRMRTREVLFMSDDMLGRAKYPKDRAKVLTGFVDDLTSFLADAAKKYKPEYRDADRLETMGYPMSMPMMMAAREAKVRSDEQAEVQAGRFTDSIERRTWTSRLDSTIDIFMSYFGDLVRFSDGQIESMYQVKDRPAAIAKILKEVKTALVDIVTSFPLCLRAVNDADRGKQTEMQLSASDADTEEVVFELVGLQLSAQDPTQLNRRPMEGMLFPIDSPSEATPAVGPGLPLFVPRSVAMGLVNRVSGLPLDADNSLTKHANKQIVGVINAASIEGNEFRVKGCLYDWSNPELVSLISANKESLGMSMNAMAKGSPRDIDGRKVFYVDSLELMGANILKSSKATFTGTNLISASGLGEEDDELIAKDELENDFVSPDFDSIVGQLNELTQDEDVDADALDLNELLTDFDEDAEADIDPTEDTEEFDDSDVAEADEDLDLDTEIQLSQKTSMTDIEKLSSQIEQFASNVNETLTQVVQAQAVLSDDYNHRQQLAEVQAAQQEQEDARYAADSIADLTIAKLQAMGFLQQPVAAAAADAAPARRTVAIAAAAGSASSGEAGESQGLLLQLAGINGQLDVLDEIPGSGEKMTALIQQAGEIRAKISRLG